MGVLWCGGAVVWGCCGVGVLFTVSKCICTTLSYILYIVVCCATPCMLHYPQVPKHPESMAAREAAVKAAKALQEARQKKAEEAARKKAEEAARKQAAFVPEEEEEETVKAPEDVHALAGSDGTQQVGLVLRKKPAPVAAQPAAESQAMPAVRVQEEEALPGMRKPTREEVLQRLAAARGGQGRQGAEDVEAVARAKVMADLAVLSSAKGGVEESREDGTHDGVWQPPSGQTGDGKTKLNQALGY